MLITDLSTLEPQQAPCSCQSDSIWIHDPALDPDKLSLSRERRMHMINLLETESPNLIQRQRCTDTD